MKLSQQQLEELVRTHALKMTPQRRAIVEYLASAQNHPTAEEIFIVVNQQFPMTSRATVYNTLHLLRQAELIQEVFESGVSRFDPKLTHHHHFVCRRCGRVEDIDESFAAPLPPKGLPQTVESVEVVFRGLCAACTTEPAN